MPGNAALFCVLLAIALHKSDPGGSAPAAPPTRSLAGPHDPRSVRAGRAARA
jgi:hypothetical protein